MKKLIQYDLDEYRENYLDYWKQNKDDCPYGVYKNDDELRNAIYDDYDLPQWHWDEVVEYLSELMSEKQKKYDGVYWKATVKNFGWRNSDGYKYFKAEDGEEFLREILPICDCTFHIFNWKNGFCIRNWHHDSPMGNEYYYVVPIKEVTYEKEI